MDLKRSANGPKSQLEKAFQRAGEVDVLDSQTLAVLRGLERPDDTIAFLDDLIDTFVKETPEILASLVTAIEDQNAPTIAHLSHQLKGLSGNIGVTRLSALCVVIEDNASMLDDLEGICRLLNQAHADSIQELQEGWKRSKVPDSRDS